MTDLLPEEKLLAAIDIGSNSFHLAIARLDHGEVRKVASMSEKVQLAAGLDENNMLSEEAQQRGLDCLSRFMGRLDAVSPDRLRIVATNALRQAKNAQVFIKQAVDILPKPIEVIAGREEARLIYLGVSHTNASTDKRLVVDIGGGSTEFIIGEGFNPLLTESLQMGCVSFSRRFFTDGNINEKNFAKAVTAARKEVLAISESYQETGWNSVAGSSGTIKAIRQIAINLGLADEQERITLAAVNEIKKRLFKLGHVKHIDFDGIKDNRKAVLPAGVAILYAIMTVLGIETMSYSDGALREGVMYDMLGRFSKEDVRDRSVQAMMARYHVDVNQAKRVVNTSHTLFTQVKSHLALSNEDADILRRSAFLHEIGLAISHSGYHRHSSYLVEHSDVAGFSQVDQLRMAQLVLNHRRKLKTDLLTQVHMVGGQSLVYLCLLLRLAVLLHHSRSDQVLPDYQLSIDKPQQWHISLATDGETNPLLIADLQEEAEQFNHWDFNLNITTTVTA